MRKGPDCDYDQWNGIVKATRHKFKLVVSFTFICSNIPAAPAYGVYIS
jgi:hypothetical protein